MIEALRIFGVIATVTFLGINVLLHFLIYPFGLMFEEMERMYMTDDERRSSKLFDGFVTDAWIPGLIMTLKLSLIAGVVVTILYYLQLLY